MKKDFLGMIKNKFHGKAATEPNTESKQAFGMGKAPKVLFEIDANSRSDEIFSVPAKDASVHEISEMQMAAVGLCQSLNVPSTVFKAQEWIDQLNKHGETESFRLSYFCITQYVFENDVEDISSGFLTNLETSADLARKIYNQNQKKLRVYKMALKFQDHVNLAIQQKHLVKKTQEAMVSEVNTVISPRINEITKDMTSQLVGMVALFTALSFIVFGAISSLEGIMDALGRATENTDSILPPLIVAVAWSFCVMNLLYCFMYFIIRVTNLNKPVDEKAKNVVQRYPIVFLTNYILLALFLLFGAFWFAECNGIGKSVFTLAIKHDTWAAVIGVLLIVIMLSIIGRILLHQFKK